VAVVGNRARQGGLAAANRRRRSNAVSRAAILASMAVTAAASAYELEPRSYSNIPVGMNFLVAGVTYQTGDVATDPALPLDDAAVDVAGAVVGLARGVDLWGRSGKFDVLFPHACMEGSAAFMGERVERDVCGRGDPSFKLSVNLIGAPAMRLPEISRYREDFIVGVGLRVVAPLGDHDAEKLLNPGANRWVFRPEAGISKTMGAWTIEGILQASLYGDNEDFLGDGKREQDPVYALQAHLVRGFARGAWLALDATGFRGGRTTLEGRRGDDLQENSRWGVTVALPLDRHHSLKFAWSSGVVTRAGGDFDTVTALWQYRWGGGL
jgi:hypothetical protein